MAANNETATVDHTSGVNKAVESPGAICITLEHEQQQLQIWQCGFVISKIVIIHLCAPYGECTICNRHLCAKNFGPKYHTCPRWEEDEKSYDLAAQETERKEIHNLLNKTNTSVLLSRASYLRNGVPCSIPQPLQYDRLTRPLLMGRVNYHIEIQFKDGISWLTHIRRSNATSPPLDLKGYIMRSEVATLRFLSKTTVPAPKVYDYNLDGETPIGLGISSWRIEMECLEREKHEWIQR